MKSATLKALLHTLCVKHGLSSLIASETLRQQVWYMMQKTFLWNSVVVPRRHPRIVVPNNADLPHGCRGSSARADEDFPCRRGGADLPCGFG